MIDSWRDKAAVKDANELLDQAREDRKWAELENTLAHAALRVERQLSAYDAGFEAGVLASEAGVGRAADA